MSQPTLRETIARIDERVENLRSDSSDMKDSLKEIHADIADLKQSRATVIGIKDFVVVGIALASALLSILWNSIKIGQTPHV